MVHCGRTMAAEEGLGALWKGLTPFIGQLTLKYALRMGSNAFFLELLRDKVGGAAQLAAAARIAGTALSGLQPCQAGCRRRGS